MVVRLDIIYPLLGSVEATPSVAKIRASIDKELS